MINITYVLLYYGVLSVILFVLMGIDKAKAMANMWRVPERVLWTFALLGGFLGGFIGMFLFHHKTRKPLFYVFYTLGMIIHIALTIFLFTKEIYIC